jgi:SMI1-KNR4 cell-wall
MYKDFDFGNFWEPADDDASEYSDEPLTDEMVAAAEQTLGYKLPKSYIALMKHQNGGVPLNTCHRTLTPTSWADGHIAITGIFAIGSEASCSLCGECSSQFWIAEWGYPPIGVYFADCPSAGHDMLCLDYSECGAEGEPRVVHVDQEREYKVTFLAANFESFVRGLESEEAFEDDDDEGDDDED